MSLELLDKTRKINKLLHNNSSSKVVFNDICEVLTGILDSDILVISKKGKVLGTGFYNNEEVNFNDTGVNIKNEYKLTDTLNNDTDLYESDIINKSDFIEISEVANNE